MSTITQLQGSDGITEANSMTKINTNFTNLNSDKIETSYLDTDTALTANSDTKIATQKAVKAYVDSGGQQNASETVRGLVEEATDAEVTAGTDTGATGAKLFVPPSKLTARINALAPVQIFKCGATTYDTATASGTQNIAHGVGAIPKYVRITASCITTNGISQAFTVYNGTTQASNSFVTDDAVEEVGTTFKIGRSTDYTTGVLTFDATNITITWTKNSNPTGTANLLWEAQY